MDLPFSFRLNPENGIPSRCDDHLLRNLSTLRGQFLDQAAYAALLARGDPLIYEVYEVKRPEI